MRSPGSIKRMELSGTSEATQTVLRSAIVMRGALVSLRYSPAATLISRILPETGADTVTFCPNVPGFRPSNRNLWSDCSRAACTCSKAALACANAFSAVSTSSVAGAGRSLSGRRTNSPPGRHIRLYPLPASTITRAPA